MTDHEIHLYNIYADLMSLSRHATPYINLFTKWVDGVQEYVAHPSREVMKRMLLMNPANYEKVIRILQPTEELLDIISEKNATFCMYQARPSGDRSETAYALRRDLISPQYIKLPKDPSFTVRPPRRSRR